MKFRLLIAAIASLWAGVACAQSTPLQGGPWTAGHLPQYINPSSSIPILVDGGGAGGGAFGANPNEIGVTATGSGLPPFVAQGTGPNGENICDYDGPTTSAAGYHALCLSANALGGGLISYNAFGGASSLPLLFQINGVLSGIVQGPGTTIPGDFACWNNTIGSLLSDCGSVIAIANGGTGQTTASGAINALLPTQTGNSGKTLSTNGMTASWQTAASGTVTSITAGAGLSGGTITGAGTIAITNSITGGGPIGSATTVPVITYNAQGELTVVTSASITGVPPGGTAGGDLSGTYPNPTVAKVNAVTYPSGPSANTVPVVTSATSGGTITYEAVPNAALANAATTVNGQPCTLGGTCTVTAAATSIAVGTTAITGGTTTDVEVNNAGVLGEQATTGTGNIVRTSSPTLVTPALGTPSALVGTNITGTASGLTAGTVTTNANLTGPITSVGNATSIAAQTGTGSTFVVSASPTIASPTFSGTVAGANTIPLGVVAQSGANTMLGNWTGLTANVAANAMPSCSDTGGNHLNYVSGTGVTCGTSDGHLGTVTSVATTGPITGGTITTTGTIACGTCATTTNGGALSASSPLAISVGGAITITSPLPLANGGTNSTTGAVIHVKNVVITSSSTWTPDTGLLYADIICDGGGGGGAGTAAAAVGQAQSGATGGAADWSEVTSSAATIGASQTVTIGAAGSAGASGDNAGGTGGDTSVGSLCIGKAGGGAFAAGGRAGGVGGGAGTGDFTNPGAPGVSGLAAVTGAINSNTAGGSGPWGGGGTTSFTANGNAGTGHGAGGGGGHDYNAGGARTGGAGSIGEVIIKEYLNQ